MRLARPSTVEVEDATLACEVVGSGRPLLVLHGGPGAVGDPAPVARGLADRFRVLEPWQMRKPQTGSGLG